MGPCSIAEQVVTLNFKAAWHLGGWQHHSLTAVLGCDADCKGISQEEDDGGGDGRWQDQAAASEQAC